MMKLKLFSLLVATALLPGSLLAQTTASVHGHVNNAAGVALTSGQVKLTTDKTAEPKDRKYKNTFDIDANGDYKGSGIAPGDYLAIVSYEKTETVDYQLVTFKAGDDKVMNFDMTRKEYMDKMTPEERAAVEEYKKKHAADVAVGAKIANLNNVLKGVRADLASKTPNFDSDVKQMQDAVAQKGDESVLWFTLGSALIASADADVAKARAEKRSWQTDEAILKKYNDAIAADQKSVETNAAAKKPNPADAATAWNSIGTVQGKLGKTEDAQASFENAAKLNPPGAGLYYGNEAAILYNASGFGTEAAGAAADKAIQIDPAKADPYFVRGMYLITKSTVVNGKTILPPECIEAFQKYLELDPNGKFSAQVKEIFAENGQSVNTKYKAPGKK